MLFKKWKRWARSRKAMNKRQMNKRHRKPNVVLVTGDDLYDTKKPPEWMQELLLNNESADTEKSA